MQTFVRRNETKPPTYLFRYYQFQRARDKKLQLRLGFPWRARRSFLSIFTVRFVVSLVSVDRVASGKGGFSVSASPPQPLFFLYITFFILILVFLILHPHTATKQTQSRHKHAVFKHYLSGNHGAALKLGALASIHSSLKKPAPPFRCPKNSISKKNHNNQSISQRFHLPGFAQQYIMNRTA